MTVTDSHIDGPLRVSRAESVSHLVKQQPLTQTDFPGAMLRRREEQFSAHRDKVLVPLRKPPSTVQTHGEFSSHSPADLLRHGRLSVFSPPLKSEPAFPGLLGF